MGKHVAYKRDDYGKYFTCQPEKNVKYGPCVHCNSHTTYHTGFFCPGVPQYWNNDLGEYSICQENSPQTN